MLFRPLYMVTILFHQTVLLALFLSIDLQVTTNPTKLSQQLFEESCCESFRTPTATGTLDFHPPQQYQENLLTCNQQTFSDETYRLIWFWHLSFGRSQMKRLLQRRNQVPRRLFVFVLTCVDDNCAE